MSSAVTMPDDAQPSVTQAENPTQAQRKGFVSRVRRWLREPLIHFLLIGLALFIAYSVITPSATQPSSRTIELTKDDLNQLEVSWRAQWQRAPTPEEMRGLIEERVRQEILYREGIALGLEQGDEIIKRRLAQKMEFLAEDVSKVREPRLEELKAWFEKNAARFALPGGITFRHLYFSPDKRGAQAHDDAARALESLAGSSANVREVSASVNRFMFQDYYADNSPEQVAKIFGTKFSESVFKLKTGAWQGPIESGLGWHLVWIDSITPGRVPAFEEVDPSQLKTEWMADQRAEAKRQAFEVMKARYQVVLPAAP